MHARNSNVLTLNGVYKSTACLWDSVYIGVAIGRKNRAIFRILQDVAMYVSGKTDTPSPFSNSSQRGTEVSGIYRLL